MTDWNKLTPQERQQFIKDAMEKAHKDAYDSAVWFSGVERPAWEELSEEERERIRGVNMEHWRKMQELGQAIREGRA